LAQFLEPQTRNPKSLIRTGSEFRTKHKLCNEKSGFGKSICIFAKKHQGHMIAEIKHGSNLSEIKKLLSRIATRKPKKGLDAKKYCGILNQREHPLVIQKKMRDEWE
jgi:hypothetical protein